MNIEIPNIPDQAELESCLGDSCKLDGSFASLWAVEVILNVARKRPEFQAHCQWIPDYLSAVFERAYSEMGLGPDTTEKGILKTPSTNYSQNINEDFKRLLNPPAPFPTIQPYHWDKAPVFHWGTVPWYGLAVLFQSQEWASGDNTPLEKREKHREKVLNWLVNEHIQSELNEKEDIEYKNMAAQLLRIMLWPPLLQDGNHHGELNLPEMKNIFESQEEPDDFVKSILKLLISQDRLISVLAGAACFLINIAPSSALEARCLKRCIQYYKTLPQTIGKESHERVIEVIQMLASSNESPLKGMKEVEYLESIRLANEQKFDLASEKLTSLIAQFPERALYVRTRGKLMEKLGKDQYAYDDYNKAIRLKSDYWQALINRGTYYAKNKKYKQAFVDYLTALKIRPDCENTRNNLLGIYYLNKTS